MAQLSPAISRAAGARVASALKSELAALIIARIDRQGLTVREAQAKSGQAAADFSRLRGKQLDRFTVERLLAIAESFGDPVSVTLRPEASDCSGVLPQILLKNLKALRSLCRRFDVTRLCAFGSVLREDFDPAQSDLDFTVTFRKAARHGPADQYFGFKAALERLLNKPIDLVELSAMDDSRIKREIQRTQVSLFEQAP